MKTSSESVLFNMALAILAKEAMFGMLPQPGHSNIDLMALQRAGVKALTFNGPQTDANGMGGQPKPTAQPKPQGNPMAGPPTVMPMGA